MIINVIFVVIFFAFANAGSAARIVPTGKVSIIERGNVIGEFNQEALLPEGFLLRCEAKCAVQLDDVNMEIEPKTAFSVSPMKNHHDLKVQQGTVYYSLNQSSRPLHFDTPVEKATIGNIYVTSGKLKGYVRAVKDVTEIGVLGGGTMVLEVGSDKMPIFSGEKLAIAITDSATKKQKGLSTSLKYTKEAIGSGRDPGSRGYRAGGRGGDGGGDSSGGGSDGGDSREGDSGVGDSDDGGSGEGDSGEGNSGDGNSGDGNSGDGNSGEGDSDDGDSGDGDSGDGDSGEGDSGEGDSGEGDSDDGGSSGGDKGGGKGGDKGGGKGSGKGGDKGGGKGGGKGGDKGGGKGGGKGGDKGGGKGGGKGGDK